MVRTSGPAVICVIGGVSAGKTTFIDRNFSVDADERLLSVIVRTGKFLRESVGLNAMAQDPQPNVCDLTEFWVRQHLKGALWTARQLKRPLVLDGQPRSVKQVHWLEDEMANIDRIGAGQDHKIPLHIIHLTTYYERQHQDPAHKAFDELRSSQSLVDVEAVIDEMCTYTRKRRDVKLHVV